MTTAQIVVNNQEQVIAFKSVSDTMETLTHFSSKPYNGGYIVTMTYDGLVDESKVSNAQKKITKI